MLLEKREEGWQHLMEQQPLDAAPHPAQPERGRLPELGDGEDAGAVEPLFHALPDAVDLLQFEAEQNVGQVVMRDDDKSVRLLQVGADFAGKDVGRQADRAGEHPPTWSREARLTFSANSRAAGTRHSVPIRRHAISSIDMTLSTGRQVSTSRCLACTAMTSAHIRRASRTNVPVLMPRRLAG